ncbi:hypothetical protein Lepto7375DRAFT_6708 [Leptolyngbya sp. PCC 7375]|nr:hypothetical protein Lepto7375DRAFT_6708 [Leptolyngbya sp. PCC 7375]
MDIDPRTYPSRTFVRFTAHNQLQADATGVPVTASVQRLGGDSYTQQAIPDGDSPSIMHGSSGFSMGFSVSPANDENPIEEPTHGGGENDQTLMPFEEPADLECENQASISGVDEALFEDIIKTTINPNSCPELFQSCGTQEAAKALEARIAARIVAAYRKIKQQQDCPIVQRFNNLL